MTANVMLVTTTAYPNMSEMRYGLAMKTLIEARVRGFPITVVDNSPDPDVAKSFERAGALVYPQIVSGMGSSRRLAFWCAAEYGMEKGISVYLWLEPEKYDFLRFIDAVTQPIFEGRNGLVIPKRSTSSWSTYPDFQVASERRINAAYGESTGLIGYDPTFGPLAVSAHFLGLLAFGQYEQVSKNVPDTYIQQYAPILARATHVGEGSYSDGIVGSVECDFRYPREQREYEETRAEEFREKRAWQEDSLIRAHRFLGSLIHYSNSFAY